MEQTKVLTEILEEIKKLSQHLITIESSILSMNSFLQKISGVGDLKGSTLSKEEKSVMPSSLDVLNLQESRPGLFITYKAIQKKDEWVSSTEIALDTDRSRGLESRYLNELADNGLVLKKRVKVAGESKATEVLYKILGVDE